MEEDRTDDRELWLEERDSRPRSLRDPELRLRRRSMLDMPHVAPLTAFAAELRANRAGDVPDFDPLDGGTGARLLFLLEKPGPATSAQGLRLGSGFISRDNDNPTAAAIHSFMRMAGLPRKATVLWNVIPWWNGTIAVKGPELKAGISRLPDLVSRLPNLQGVVLVGRHAASARQALTGTGLLLSTSDHPSPNVRAGFRQRWDAIPRVWARAGAQLGLAVTGEIVNG